MQKLLRSHVLKVLLIAAMLTGINSWGQTNPTAQSIPYSQDFSTFTGSVTTYPAGWQGWNITGSLASTYPTTAPASDRALTAGNNTLATAGVFDMSGKMGTGSTSGTLCAPALSIITTGYTSVNVSFKAATQRNESTTGRVNGLGLQYRVGTSGTFTDVAGSEYTSVLTSVNTSGTGSIGASTISVTLPIAAENKAVVQLRWVMRDISGSGNRPTVSIDDIAVTGTSAGPTVTTTTGSYGPFCANTSNNIVVNYTTGGTGSFTGTYSVQRSNVGGTFPSDATSNLLTTVTSSAGSVTATIPSGLTSGNYRVRVVNSTPATFSSNDNGSNIVLTASVTQVVSLLAVQPATITSSTGTLRSDFSTAGVCPATIEKGFVYSRTSDNADPLIGGAGVTQTPVSGVSTGVYSLPLTGLSAETSYTYKGYVYNGTTYTYTNPGTFPTTGTPPALTAAIGATVDGPFAITFTDNATWRTNITSITVDGSAISASAYNKTVAGQITFTPSFATALQTPGTKAIVIISTNYSNGTVSQTIAAGAPAKLALTTQPTAPLTNGGTLTAQPVVVVRDQYNNLTASTAPITAAATAATWTLGGTTTINASAGTAAFSGLTASTPTGLTGAAIQFTSPGLISVPSNTFSIPPSNDLCGNATVVTVNAAAVAGTNVGSTYTAYTGSSNTKKDVWYTFVATCNGSHTITVSDFSGDIDLALHTGATCPSSVASFSISSSNNPEVLTATLVSGTTYYIRVIAYNTTAESSAFNIQVVNAFVPTVTAGSATSITTGGATVPGTATISGCSPAITAYGVEYSLISNFTNGSGTQVAGSNLSGSSFSVPITGLTPGKTYYYKTYATNGMGTAYSTPQASFTIPTIAVTLPYTQDFEGTANEWAFGTAGANKWVIGTGAKNGGSKGLYISNNGTAYAYTTSTTAVTTDAEVRVDLTSVTSATLSFDWKSEGETGAFGGGLDYGEVYINTGSTDVLISTTKEFFGTTVYQLRDIDLTAYVGGVRTLKFRWVNDTSSGTGNPFAIDNISIIAGLKPTVTTTAASNVASNSATSGGTVSGAGSSSVTARGVVYSTTANPVLLTGTAVNSGTGTGAFSSNIIGLTDGVTYYVRAFATNATGTAYGTQVTFTTTSVSAPVATAATFSDTPNSGFMANWNAATGATGYKFDLSTSSTFGTIIPATDLFFSEYVEGSGNQKYLEIYNGTGATVDLSNYQIRQYTNGASSATITVALSGMLANGATAVYGGSSATAYTGTYTAIAVDFNGDDAIGLWKISTGTHVDIFGRIGSDPGTGWTSTSNATLDKTLVRKPAVTGGITTSPTGTGATAFTTLESEWTQYSQDDVSHLGSHNYGGFNPSFVAGYNDLSVAGTSKDVTGLTPGTTYYYRVRAVGANTTSASSNTITAVAKRENIWTAGAWTFGTPPTALDKATIAGDYNTGTNGGLTVGQLEVNNNTFTIASGTNVTVTNAVIVGNNANMVIENNGNLIQVNDVDNSGAVTVQKNSAPIYRLDYEMWSSPVAGETLIGFSPETISTRFYHYNPLSDEYATVPGSTTFAEGAGYLIRVANTHPAFVNAQTPGTSWHGTFVGTPNNGNVDVAVTPQQSGVSQGYNAVGNPYPSPINIHAFYAANTSTIADASALYFWRKKNDAATGSYARVTKLAYTANTSNSWGDAGGTAFNGAPNTWVINPGQGFIVQATGSTVHFNNAMRVPVNNGQIFRSAQDESESQISRLWLNLSGQDGFSQAAIGYTDMTTLGLDYGWDGKAFINDGDVTLFSLAGEETLGIQARPSFEVSDVVPMGYQATQAGSYTISLDHMDGIFETDQNIYLQDNLLNVTHNLKDGAYEFTTEAGVITNRFNVIYAQPLGTVNPVFDANSVIVYKDGNSISINSGTVDMTNVSVYDTRGRLLYNGKDINATETVISGLQAEKQVLIVNISTVKGEVSKKIIF